MKVVTLIADLVDSRLIVERNRFQQQLKQQLQMASASAGDRLLSPYTLTLGDEFQALYRNFAGCQQELIELMCAVYPQRLRFALARGRLDTDINRGATLEMDGPAFHTARALMDQLKDQKRSIIAVGGETGVDSGLANACLRLVAGEMTGWKANTWTLFRMLSGRADTEQMQATTGLGRRAVYKQLATRRLRDHRDLLQGLFTALDSPEAEARS